MCRYDAAVLHPRGYQFTKDDYLRCGQGILNLWASPELWC